MWRRGDAIREMERTLGETLPRIRRYLRESGGIPPIPRRRRSDHLSLEEREEISRGIAAGLSARTIAGRISRSSSTVSREIARNGGRDAYRALVADAAAFDRARRPKSTKLAANPQLRGVVADKLDDDWSPQQIAQWLRREFLDDAAMRISKESIYRDLYMPSRKVFDASMFHCLRSGRSIRRPRGKKRSHGRGQIRNMVSIRERPTEADTRQVAGHWEGDLVFGARPSAVATPWRGPPGPQTGTQTHLRPTPITHGPQPRAGPLHRSGRSIGDRGLIVGLFFRPLGIVAAVGFAALLIGAVVSTPSPATTPTRSYVHRRSHQLRALLSVSAAAAVILALTMSPN